MTKIDDVPTLLRAQGLADIAIEWQFMQEALAYYANDEERTLNEEGEAYGSIPPQIGINARRHRASYNRRREAAVTEDW